MRPKVAPGAMPMMPTTALRPHARGLEAHDQRTAIHEAAALRGCERLRGGGHMRKYHVSEMRIIRLVEILQLRWMWT